jgi:hypothetical protein
VLVRKLLFRLLFLPPISDDKIEDKLMVSCDSDMSSSIDDSEDSGGEFSGCFSPLG